MKQIKTLSVLAIVAAAITGCSGGAGSGGMPVQQAPQILGPVTAELDQGTTSQPLGFKITDNDTASDMLQISVRRTCFQTYLPLLLAALGRHRSDSLAGPQDRRHGRRSRAARHAGN